MTSPARSRNVIFCFPGQGSQLFRAGESQLAQDVVFSTWMKRADVLARKYLDMPLLQRLYDPNKGPLDPMLDVRLSHPVVFAFGYAIAQSLMSRGVMPSAVLGASLGEFTALAVAGAASFEELFIAVAALARANEAFAPPGVMYGVMGNARHQLQHEVLRTNTTIAGVVSPDQIILTASVEARGAVELALGELGLPYKQLPIGYPFHSARMDPSGAPFLDALGALSLRPVVVPCYSCATTRSFPVSSDRSRGVPSGISASHLWRAVREPILQWDTLRGCSSALGAESNIAFVDCGPSPTVAAVVARHMNGRASAYSVARPAKLGEIGLEPLLKDLATGEMAF